MKSFLLKIFPKSQVKTIEFCQNNLDRFLDQESNMKFQRLLAENKISNKEYECLSHCKLCEEKPFFILNGELLSGTNMNELIQQLQEKLSQS